MQNNISKWFFLLSCAISGSVFSQTTVRGSVFTENGEPVYGAAVIVKELRTGATTNEEGFFQLNLASGGTYTLQVSYLGYEPLNKVLNLDDKKRLYVNIRLKESSNELETVQLTAKSKIQQIEALAYNVDVIDAKRLHNTTLDIGHALDRVSGIRIRESGGVGSEMNLSMNGFRGNQVKTFIDGIPMEYFGSSFQINNIPIGLAQRVEIYKGVVPVELGADALGGAINIVTTTYEKDHLDLSYSYGSFNTHRSNVNATYVSKSDFVINVNAFQNYSDNDYKVTVDAANLNTGEYYPETRLRRFHDQYHNETFIGKTGVVNKSFADELLFGITLGQNYNEEQTGARLVAVYGARHTRGNIVMPSITYKKENLFVDGLDLKLNATINLGKEKIIDTLNRTYNWFGDYKEYDSPVGELNYSNLEIQNNNGIGMLSIKYDLNEKSFLSFNDTYTTFDRERYSYLQTENRNYDQPQKTFKNVAGLSFTYETGDWNATVFAKNYNQNIEFTREIDPGGSADISYNYFERKLNEFGYGFAATYFFDDKFQFKASYEKSYRLPLPNELFGDANLIVGDTSLDPEESDNYNLGVSYWLNLGKNQLFNIDATIIYRDIDNFIRRTFAPNQSRFLTANVVGSDNLGFEAQFRYNYRNKLTANISGTYQNFRNNNPESAAYRARIPNVPFLFGNGNIAYSFNDVFKKGNNLTMEYNLLYVNGFYLNWPLFGDRDEGKLDIPDQIAHDLNFTYSTPHFQFIVECRNIFDEILYDNFSLQKPGRSFTGKIRYTL
ncbi:TonB-dependent receptor [Autumnicola musiva]|uniref:TonB-dependent receptor n=1 Tax=Autumnicola musiva TaxID=3075589 RepID=A0ABU3D810_9FLAO|nr:TonB-dependent receptor [Zunongwangia sp. F117]MDT0677669.1 TonB-dependent receptor [Zunongwangia sp. F117]